MTPENLEPDETTGADTPDPEAARSADAEASAADETARAASAEDAPAPAQSAETPQAEDEPEPDAAAQKPARRPRRRRAAEPPAEPEAVETEAEAAQPEADAAEADATEADAAESDAAEADAAEDDDETPAAPAARPAQPAPTRRRSRREPGEPAPVVRAQAKYVRSSARKARLVCDNIRGKSVDEARAILAVTPRAIARDWTKLLESAIANAEHNHELVGEDLYVKAVHADEGPTIKRFRPRAMGRATAIRKRTSHLTILLTPKN
jgi:ribosomal protein L22